jgi:hypothetical protein
MVFVFYQFAPPPVFFNPTEVRKIEASPHADAFAEIQSRHVRAVDQRRVRIDALIEARRAGDPMQVEGAERALREAQAGVMDVRGEAVELMQVNDPGAQTSDTNYIFLTFVLNHLPVGVVGMVLAAIFAASMSSTSAELNALASTTVVDVYRRLRWRGRRPPRPGISDTDADVPAPAAVELDARDRHEVRVSKLSTLLWGAFAIGFAEFANRLGSLIEAINILGSLFYPTILGIFLTAFLLKRVGGHAVFVAALIAQAAVVYLYLFTGIAFLWYNLGCLLVMALALLLQAVFDVARARPAMA